MTAPTPTEQSIEDDIYIILTSVCPYKKGSTFCKAFHKAMESAQAQLNLLLQEAKVDELEKLKLHLPAIGVYSGDEKFDAIYDSCLEAVGKTIDAHLKTLTPKRNRT